MATIPINTLSPTDSLPADKSIRAVITLLWPYSSSTKQCALLLADPDFRLRNRKGQVRVRFTGASAEAIARGKIGIGDEVVLALYGATWASESGKVSTPGKSVDGELVYRGDLELSVAKKANGEEAGLSIRVHESTPPPEQPDAPIRAPNGASVATPARATPSYLRSSLGGADVVPIYSSPAFVRRLRLSEELKSSWDPFADIEAELEGPPSKKQRVSLSGVNRWKMAERTPSPEKEDADMAMADDEHVAAEASQGTAMNQAHGGTVLGKPSLPAREAAPPQTPFQPKVVDFGQAVETPSMAPPPLPKLQLPAQQPVSESNQHGADHQGPSTPKLQPVPSSALPLPSPFPTETVVPHFSPAHPVSQSDLVQEASISQQLNQAPASSTVVEDTERTGSMPSSPVAHRGPPRSVIEESQRIMESYNDSLASTASQLAGGASQDLSTDNRASQPETQTQEEEYLSDTEEDEEMYSQHLRRRATSVDELGRRLVEPQHDEDNYDDRSDMDEDEVEEVIEDMGEPPEESSEDDAVGAQESEDSGDEAGDEVEEGVDDARPTVLAPQNVEVIEIEEPPQNQRSMTESQAQEVGVPAHQALRDSLSQKPARDNAVEVQGTTQESQSIVNQFEEAAQQADNLDAPVHATIEPEASEPAELPNQPVQTPARPSLGLFSLDGAFDAPTRSAPRSEKDRVMRKTYSSLFGFKASPSPERQRAPQPQQQMQPPVSKLDFAPALARPLSTSDKPFSDDFDVEVSAATNETDGSAPVAEVKDGSLLETVLHDQTLQEASVQLHDEAQLVDKEKATDTNVAPGDGLNEDVEMDETPVMASDDPVGEGASINKELGEAITTSNTPATSQLPSSSAAPRPSQLVDVIDLGSSDNEDEPEERMTGQDLGPATHGDRSTIPESLQDHIIPPPPELDDDVSSHRHLEDRNNQFLSQFGRPTTVLDLQVPISQGQDSQSTDMLDITQTTVDKSEIRTPVAFHDDYTVPETVQDEALPSAAPGQQSFSMDQMEPQNADTIAVDLPLTQQTTAVPFENAYASFQSATSIATDNSDRVGPAVSASDVQDANLSQHGLPLPTADEPADVEPASLPNVANILNSNLATASQATVIRASSVPGSQADVIDLASSSPHAEVVGETSVIQDSHVDTDMADDESATSQITAVRQGSPPEVITPVNEDDVTMLDEEVDQTELPQDADVPEEDNVTSSVVGSFAQFAQPPEVFVSSEADDIVPEEQALVDEDDGAADQSPSLRSEAAQQVDASQQLEKQLVEASSEQPLHSHMPLSPEQSQHRIESQPFETQAQLRTELPPTPELTSHSLLNRMLDDAETTTDDTPTQEPTTPKRTRRSQSVVSEVSSQTRPRRAAVRRSPRKAQAGQQIAEETVEVDAVVKTSAIDQTTSPRRTRQSKEPEALLSPQHKTPVRRSPRKSQVDVEVLQLDEHSKPVHVHEESIVESVTPEPEDITSEEVVKATTLSPAIRMSTRRSPRKSQAKVHVQDAGESEETSTASSLPNRRPATKLIPQAAAGIADDEVTKADEEDTTEPAVPKKTPARRSFASRLSNVPGVISNWFSPRRSTRQASEAEQEIQDEKENEKLETAEIPSAGFATKLAYYSPLANIAEKLNPASQTYGDNTVDVLAVVTNDTTEPKRAKTGQRDYYTIFRVTDTSMDEKTSVRVEVFRPWVAVLPVAKAGDIILLRSFVVKSKSRQAYLLSTDPSAWCVWRYGSEAEPQSPASSRPAWARRNRATSFSGVKEQVLGPPVELGDEERKRAAELRAWWMSLGGGDADQEEE